jgi:hypothetical protein
MRPPRCLCVCESHDNNFWMPDSIFMKLDMYIMALEPISTAYFINPSRQALCLCILLFLSNGSAKRYRRNEYTRNNTRIVGGIVFYAVRIVSKESRRLVLQTTFFIVILDFVKSQFLFKATVSWKLVVFPSLRDVISWRIQPIFQILSFVKMGNVRWSCPYSWLI